MLVTSTPSRMSEMLQLCKMFVKGNADPMADETVKNVKGFTVFTEAVLFLLDAEKLIPDTMPMSEMCSIVSSNLDRSEEHTSELQSLMRISYAVFCLKNNKIISC